MNVFNVGLITGFVIGLAYDDDEDYGFSIILNIGPVQIVYTRLNPELFEE